MMYKPFFSFHLSLPAPAASFHSTSSTTINIVPKQNVTDVKQVKIDLAKFIWKRAAGGRGEGSQ